jgi:hypothetical protein
MAWPDLAVHVALTAVGALALLALLALLAALILALAALLLLLLAWILALRIVLLLLRIAGLFVRHGVHFPKLSCASAAPCRGATGLGPHCSARGCDT